MKKRSVGVTIFAVLFIIGGLLALLSLVTTPAALRTALQAPGITAENKTQMETALSLFQSRIWLIALQSLAGLAAGIGLFMLLGWARWLTIILAGLSVVQVGISLVTQRGMPAGVAGGMATRTGAKLCVGAGEDSGMSGGGVACPVGGAAARSVTTMTARPAEMGDGMRALQHDGPGGGNRDETDPATARAVPPALDRWRQWW